jgi:hypothetical protein
MRCGPLRQCRGLPVIRDRLWLSPLWVQGLVKAAICTIFVGAVVVELYPMFILRVGWPLTALAVIALCVITTSAVLLMQRPARQRGLDALGGGTQQDRLAVLAALRTGEVPTDPGVIAGAIRYGDVVQAYQRKISRAQRALGWLVPAVAISYGVVELLRLPPQFGVLLIAVGLWWIVLSVLRAHRRRRTLRNLEALRAAAPDLVSAGEAETVTALPPLRFRLALAAVVIPVVAFMTLVYVVIRADPDCYYVAGAADLIHDQWQLTDPQNMTRGQPDLATYRNWAQQLHSYAEHVTDPRLAPHMDRISQLADQAVTLFAQSRDAMVKQPPGYDLGTQQRALSATVQKLADKDNAVFAVCFPRH